MAGQVVGTSVSTSPLSYSTMAGQCEALEAGTRKKLSNWLAQENSSSGEAFAFPSDAATVTYPVSFVKILRTLYYCYLFLHVPDL